MTVKPVQTADKKKRVRSPNFPAIDLETAVKRAKEYYAKEPHRHWTNAEIASKHWSYSSMTSGGALVVAALIAYGLMEDEGSRDERKVRLTELGFTIVLDDRPNSADVAEALKEAALKPRIYNDLWNKWEGVLPSNENIRYYLLRDLEFNQKSVDGFIEDFRHTLTFAGLLNSDKVAPPPPKPVIAVGDYVQWESNGELKFEKPRKVLGFYADGWAQVEGTGIGVPVAQLTKENPPAEGEGKAGKIVEAVGSTKPPKPGMNEDKFSLPSGDAVLQWPASMTETEYQFAEKWLDLMKLKMKFGVQPNPVKPNEEK